MLDRMLEELKGEDRGQIGNLDIGGVILGIGVALIISAVVVMILNSTYDTMALDSNDTLYNSSESVIDATEQTFDFLPIVMIVIMAVIVISALYLVRGRR